MSKLTGRIKAVQYTCVDDIDVVVPYEYFTTKREARKKLRSLKRRLKGFGWCNIYVYKTILTTRVSSNPEDRYWGWIPSQANEFKLRNNWDLWYIEPPIPICDKERAYGKN